jgi:hypothetical protein
VIFTSLHPRPTSHAHRPRSLPARPQLRGDPSSPGQPVVVECCSSGSDRPALSPVCYSSRAFSLRQQPGHNPSAAAGIPPSRVLPHRSQASDSTAEMCDQDGSRVISISLRPDTTLARSAPAHTSHRVSFNQHFVQYTPKCWLRLCPTTDQPGVSLGHTPSRDRFSPVRAHHFLWPPLLTEILQTIFLVR